MNPRHWLLIARRGEGKSTFASQMSPEYLVCDLDGRWAEQKVTAQSHIIAESDPLKMVSEMEKLRAALQGKIGTVTYDSGTAVMDFIGAKGRLMEAAAKAANGKFNNDDVNKLKADTMRLLRFAALKWHCDVLWIFHMEDNMKAGAKGERTTISKMEIERMKANLNAVLTIVKNKSGKRGIRIEWSRYNNGIAQGQTVWDDLGLWRGVPAKLDVFLQSFMGDEGYQGNAYSGEWLFEYLDGKGVKFADMHEMYIKLDVREEPAWFDRAGWGAFIKKATG